MRRQQLGMESLEPRLPMANGAQVFNSGVFTLPGDDSSLETMQVRRIDGGVSNDDPTTLVGFVVDDSTGSLDSLPEDEAYAVRALARARNRVMYFGDQEATFRLKGGSQFSFGVIAGSDIGGWLREFVADPSGSSIGFMYPVENHSNAVITTRGNNVWQMDWNIGGEDYSYEITLPSEELASGVIVESFIGTDSADVQPGPTLQEGDSITLSYTVTNPGSTPLSNVTVTDDNGTPDDDTDDLVANSSVVPSGVNQGDFNSNSLLDPGETWLFTAQTTARPGQFTSVAMVSGNVADGESVTACDPTNYTVEALGETDISIISITPNPEPIGAATEDLEPRYVTDTTYELRPVISNTGEEPVDGPFEVEFTFQDAREIISTEGTIQPGEEITLSPFDIVVADVGQYEWIFDLDPNNNIDESDEEPDSNRLVMTVEFVLRRPS